MTVGTSTAIDSSGDPGTYSGTVVVGVAVVGGTGLGDAVVTGGTVVAGLAVLEGGTAVELPGPSRASPLEHAPPRHDAETMSAMTDRRGTDER